MYTTVNDHNHRHSDHPSPHSSPLYLFCPPQSSSPPLLITNQFSISTHLFLFGLFIGFVLFVQVLDPISEKAMAPHSSTFAWKIPWMEEPGRLQSMGSLELDTTERLHFQFSLSCIGEGNGNPLQCSCLENPRDGEAWWAAVYGVTQSWTRLKRLSSSSRSHICVLFFQNNGIV